DAAGLSGFDSINITVLPTEVPPEIFSIHVQRNINPNLLITDINETPIIFSTVGESLDFSFTAMDPNGNETLDSYWVHRDGILVNTSNEYSFQYLSPTEITLTFFVNDSTSLIGNASVIIRNGTNSPPQISNLAVVNALNASEDITEDSFINITFDAFDVDGNLHFTQVFLNDDLISSGPVSEYYFGFGTSGIYNVTVRAVDYEGAETNASILFEVLQKDVPPEITSVSVFINNTIVTPSPFSTLYSFEGDLITIGFTAVDPNDDLETQQIFRNGQVIGADSAIWNVNVTAAGLYEILLNATDETALSDTFRFNISIRENLPPEDISLMVSNNTGGSFIRGGDLIHIIANATDPENLPIQYEIFFDGVSLGLGRQKSLVLPELLHGDVNISVLVSDLKHTVLHWTIFTVEKSDQAPVIESIGISSQTIPATVIDASSTFSLEIQEGESLFIEPYVSDFNDNLDIVNISILFNDSTNGWEFYDQNLTSILFNPAQGAIGTYSINVLARDDTNLESFFNFSVQVTENLAPNITGISITNSTGGFILSEGGTLDLDVNFTNVFPNEGSIFVSFNGVPLSITRSGSRVQSSYSIPYTARGDNVLNITIIDQLGARTENISLVSIAPTPVAPDILNVLVTTRNGSSYTPQELESIFVQESDGPNSNYVNITYDIFDLNGIDTITSNILTIDGLEQNSRILGYGSSGNYSVQIHVTDLDGLTTTYEFYLFVIQNQAPLVSVSILNSSLGNESFLQGDPVTINATVFDINRDLDSVSLYINQNLVSFDSVLGNTYLYTLETSVFRDELVNITILAKDYEGLVNISENMIFITERNLPPVIESATITNNFTSFIMEVQDTETIGLNQTINISFDVYDPNNDSMTFRIEVNGITISNNYTAQYFLNSLGLFNITFFANDSVFESSESIFLDVQAPQAPIINSISLWNSTNGTTLVEGDSVQYYVNITDINKDITTMSVLFSKNGSGMFINNSHQFSLTNYSWNISFDQLEGMFELPGFIHPNLSITVRLETSTNLQNSYVTQVFVENEEFAPQIQNAFVGDEPVSQNDLIARYSPSDTITLTFDPVDPDLDGDFVSIRIDNLTYNVSMHSFTIPSNSVGRIFNITYFVNDSLGNTDTLFYRLRVVEREVRTVTTTSPSSPGGSAPPPTPRAPQRTPEVSIGNIPTIRLENLETRRIPLTIFNIGDEDLIDLELEILNGHHNISFTYEIDGEANIPANGSRVVYVTITSLGSIQDGEFEVIARGKSLSGDERIFRDLSKIFINKEDESRDDRETFEVLLPEVVQVLTDNARCLDLMRYVEEADLAASNGDYSVANEILSFAKEACMEQARDFTLVPEGNIFTRQDRTGFIILFSVVLLLAAILVPSIILAHKHTQKKKNVDKDKEEEIEKFLEDMY
ncbi:MAG: hypothetical protein ACMXYK_03135, partial [Candidatus Woesearchaeota archaeon]